MDLTESLTLRGVNITGEVLGRFGIYTVSQNYDNDSGKTLEVFFTFPLPRTASVYDFVARIGDKVIRGLVKEKVQAKKEYQSALVRGGFCISLRTRGRQRIQGYIRKSRKRRKSRDQSFVHCRTRYNGQHR